MRTTGVRLGKSSLFLRRLEIAVELGWNLMKGVLSREQMWLKPFRSLRSEVSQQKSVTTQDSPTVPS